MEINTPKEWATPQIDRVCALWQVAVMIYTRPGLSGALPVCFPLSKQWEEFTKKIPEWKALDLNDEEQFLQVLEEQNVQHQLTCLLIMRTEREK